MNCRMLTISLKGIHRFCDDQKNPETRYFFAAGTEYTSYTNMWAFQTYFPQFFVQIYRKDGKKVDNFEKACII